LKDLKKHIKSFLRFTLDIFEVYDKMKDKITKEIFEKYYNLTSKAFSIVKESVFSEKQNEAGKIIEMVESYLSDSKHFESKGDMINAFGAVYYAHGWIDCGVRLGVFDVDDDSLFTLK